MLAIPTFGLLLGAVGSSALAQADTPVSALCASKLPGDLQAFLRKNFPSWKIVDLPNLRQDDRLLWANKRPTECPGVTVGRFFDLNQEAYGVHLYRVSDPGTRHEKLVVFEKHKARISSRMVGDWKASVGEPHTVIWKLEPGEYESADRSAKIQTRLDSIVLELIEAAAKMYYWEGGQFRTLMISE